jgi:hypothetical protein
MWQKTQADLLREEINEVLSSLVDTPDLHELIKEPLAEARRGLAADNASDRPWPLLSLMYAKL